VNIPGTELTRGDYLFPLVVATVLVGAVVLLTDEAADPAAVVGTATAIYGAAVARVAVGAGREESVTDLGLGDFARKKAVDYLVVLSGLIVGGTVGVVAASLALAVVG
jgi:hypothetical protein